MNHSHEPRPEFITQLAWQLRTTIRREGRFAPQAERRCSWERLRVAALVLISILVGVGGVLATEEIQEVQAQEVLLGQIRNKLRTAEAQLELVRSRLQEIEREVEQKAQPGALEQDVLLTARLSVREIETTISKLHLDEEEVQQTGEKPNNEVSAPVIGRRDFVTERLHLDAALAEERLNRWQRSTTEIEAEIEDLLQTSPSTIEDRESLAVALGEARNSLQEGRTHVGEAQRELRVFTAKLLRRQKYLAGQLSANEVKNQVRLEELTAELFFRELLRRIAHEHLWEVQGRAGSGENRARAAEVRRARLEALTQDLLLGLAQVKFRMDQTSAGEGGGS